MPSFSRQDIITYYDITLDINTIPNLTLHIPISSLMIIVMTMMVMMMMMTMIMMEEISTQNGPFNPNSNYMPSCVSQ